MHARNFVSCLLITAFCLSATPAVFALASIEDESAWSTAISNASLQLVHNNPDEAERYYDQALVEARKLGRNTAEEITTLDEKAAFLANRNRLAQAQELRQTAVDVASNTDDPDHLSLQIDALEKLNKIMIKRHQLSDSALEARLIKLKAEREKADNNVDFSNYLARLQMIVRKNWRPPLEKNQWQDIDCFWRILKDGNTDLLRVTSSSGDEEMDHSALAAVRRASPFEALPEAAPAAVDISFTFNYNSMKDASRSHQRLFKQDQRNSVDVLQSELTFATKKAGPNDPSLISILVGLANGLEGADQFVEAEKDQIKPCLSINLTILQIR